MAVKPGKYVVKVRDNNLNLIGEVQPYMLQLKSRFNIPGNWLMTLGSNDPMAGYLATRGYGIYVLRNGAYYFSGPMRYIYRQGIGAKLLTVGGYDDLVWVAGREAYPVTNAPYQGLLSINQMLAAYTFGDTNATAVDFSGISGNGAYHGGYTQSQASLIDDPALATLFNGTSGYVSVPTASLPSSNHAFSLLCWFNYTGAPSSTAVLAFLGTPSSINSAYMGILNTGIPTMQFHGTNYSGTSALAVGVHQMCVTYDGTTASLWIDDVKVKTATPTTGTIAYGSASFGCYGAGASNFTPYTLQYGVIFNNALGNASLPGSDLNGLPWPQVYYYQGRSRFAAQTYDTETGPAETVIKTYVSNNASGGATTERQVPNLVVDTDAAQGATVTYNARFEQLLDQQNGGLLQILALAGGVGFKVVQTSTPSLLFKVYVPASNSAAKFSKALGNLAEYDYTDDAQHIANAVVVAGGGTGPARVYQSQSDATSVSGWGRFEGFVNGGSATDRSQLANQATAALDSTAEKTAFNCQIIETDGLQYIRDYNLGDQVTIEADGVTLTELIREVDVTLDAQAGETLTIAIGTPSYAQILGALAGYIRRNQELATRLALLEKV